MKRWIRWLVILGILGLLAVLIGGSGYAYWKERSKVTYRQAEVTRGKVVAVVNSTGTIKPVISVTVGSFVAGPIKELGKDKFGNDIDRLSRVEKGQVLALIDPKIYEAARDVAAATLASQEAAVERAQANYELARNKKDRGENLRKLNELYISDQEMDELRFTCKAVKADLVAADKLVDQAKANLNQAEANLNYTKIVSPVDGVVIDKKIEPGQTVAGSQFQTPELFVVVPNMDKEIYVVAAVDEADIALIELAKRSNQPVHFTVDSSPDDLFEGKIVQIRMDSTTTQNVVTYPVVVSAPNPDLKLKPGMTASVTFQVRSTQDVLRIPNAALRYFPPRDLVRLEDRAIIENKIATVEADESTATRRSAEEKAELRRKRNRRHVWVVDGDKLRAVEVVVGLSNNQHTELVSGDLQEGDKLVTGIQAK